MNISLICACKNRKNALRISLSSWLNCKQIKEIIIVDWFSDDSIEDFLKIDDRIKIVRVINEDYFNLPQPLNLAASLCTQDYILKADVDYILNPYYDFFENYNADDISFLTGKNGQESKEFYSEESQTYIFDKIAMSDQDIDDYFKAYSPFFRYLSGFLLVKRNNFNKVGGYNENLGEYYGYEDDELYHRLELLGLEHRKIIFDYKLIHIPHPDTKRLENYKGYDPSELDIFKDRLRINRPYQSEQEIHWESEYVLTLEQSKKSKGLVEKSNNYFVEKKINWNIEKVGSTGRFFIASKENNNILSAMTSIYCMNLEECVDRRNSIIDKFSQYGKQVNFITSKKFAESNDIVTGKYAFQLNDGTKGCCVSHLKAIKHWYENTDYEYGFFCEDDLSLETVQHWGFSWEEFINSLPENWDCVQLLSVRKDFGDIKLRDRYWDDWSVTAYIMKREYAKMVIDTYCIGDTFNLEIPEQDVMPLIENILFSSVGKSYTYPLFVEDTTFRSTFEGDDDDVKDGQKNNHYKAHDYVLNWWKNKNNKEDRKMAKGFIVRANFSNKKTSKIIDCFSYRGKKEILEFRINLLINSVDKFIIIDSNYSHDGEEIGFNCNNVIKELGLSDQKIEVVEVDLSPDNLKDPNDYDMYINSNSNIESRERIQRDYLCEILDRFEDDDVFIISDDNEIIDPNNIKFLSELVKNNPNVVIKVPLVYLKRRADIRLCNMDGSITDWNKSMFMCMKSHLTKSKPSYIRSNYNVPYEITYSTDNGIVLQDLGWYFDIRKNNHLPLNYLEYSSDKLPHIIFELNRVREFMFPNCEQKESERVTLNYEDLDVFTAYSLNTEDPIANFNLAYWYEQSGHNAPALSYFLRCAERTEDKTLAYEALIHASNSYDRQGTRDGTAKGILQQALCLVPERPEAYFLLSRFCERRQCWQECYIYADQALRNCDFDCDPLSTDVEYPGKYGLIFEKAVSGWWWGKTEESKQLFLEVKNNYDILDQYKVAIEENLNKF